MSKASDLLIEIGSWLGAGTTIFLVVFTAVLGAALVRAQGFSTLRRVQEQLAQEQIPALEIMEGMALFAAGALLLTPGFFTDAAGFILLTPPLRRFFIRKLIERGALQGRASFHGDVHWVCISTMATACFHKHQQRSTRLRAHNGRI